MRPVVVQRERVRPAGAREGQPLLTGQPVDTADRPQRQGVLGGSREAGFEQFGHIPGLDGAKRRPAGRRFDLHQRLEPECTARAVPDYFDLDTTLPRLFSHGSRHGIRAERAGRGIARHEHLHGVHSAASRRSINSSNFTAETRAWISSLIRIEGEQAQLPRQ
jgi:hypothetical protein